MASSSSDSSIIKHDVFISFRGEDTRDNFTSHLYAALCRKQIETFIDNELLQRGHEISQSLLRAIQASKLSIIVFSQGYASSTWCLDELVEIIHCKNSIGQIVLPVFYHVDPSNVRKQTGSFAAEFDKYVEVFPEKKVQRWRSALGEAANLSGWDSSVVRPESMLVEKIVTDILKKLNLVSSSVSKSLVGIDSRMQNVMSLLCLGSSDYRKIGIWGMGGIGKTTLAEAIFNQISIHFESYYFLNNVRESEQNGSLARLKNDLLSRLLEEEKLHISTPKLSPTFIKNRLSRKKVLIILDDVSVSTQLEALLGGLEHLGPGSRIIVTTRDKQVLDYYNIKEVYEVEKLNNYEALQLFCQHASIQTQSLEEYYLEMSNVVVNYAQGVPLALEVLGSSLHHKSRRYWESALQKIKKVPNPKVLDVLKISYDELDDEEKDIFLDIACFFKGEQRDYVMKILARCYYSVDSGISDLIDKSLITISQFETIEMHHLLQELGWHIVIQESKEEPGKRTRLWVPEDIRHVLSKNTGTEKIKGIFLESSRVKEMNLSPRAFGKMHNLEFLKVYHDIFQERDNVHLPRGLKSLPDELKYLCWHGYPLKSLPSKFCPENLVVLDMRYSSVKQLWHGVQNLVNLQEIYLNESKDLIELPDLSRATNLEHMFLTGCESLIEVPSSIRNLNKLIKLVLINCRKLTSLPNNMDLKSLTHLYLDGCTNMKKFPEISSSIKHLHLSETAIEEVPSAIEHISGLVELHMKNCRMLNNLPSSLYNLYSLKVLNLNGCVSITEFPECQEKVLAVPSVSKRIPALCKLSLRQCKQLKALPASIWKLKNLHKLDLLGCSRLDHIPEILETMEYLVDVYLNETAISELPSSIHRLVKLQYLSLANCKNISYLPSTLGHLKTLRILRVSGSAVLALPSSLTHLTHMRELYISGCQSPKHKAFMLPSLSGLRYLRKLRLKDLHLLEIPENINCVSSLRRLDISGNDFERVPATINELFELEWLDLSHCKMLQSLPELSQSPLQVNAHGCNLLEMISAKQQFLCPSGYGMYNFSNCFKLTQDAHNNIVANAQQCFQSMAEECSQVYIRQVIISLPGCEVSKWFSHQNPGSSITIHLPLNRGGTSKLLGFAFCIVVAFEEYHRNDSELTIKCDYRLETSQGDRFDLSCSFRPWKFFAGQPRSLGSNHEFLLYDESIYGNTVGKYFANNCAYDKVSFKFCFVDEKLEPLRYCKVKDCGVRALYDNDRYFSLRDEYSEVDRGIGNPQHHKLKRSLSFVEEKQVDVKRLKQTVVLSRGSQSCKSWLAC